MYAAKSFESYDTSRHGSRNRHPFEFGTQVFVFHYGMILQ